jgi:hypothetical protein
VVIPPPPDAPPTSTGPCKATPGPNAGKGKLRFTPIELAGLPAGGAGTGKNPIGLTELRFLPGRPNEFLIAQKGGQMNHFTLAGNRATFVRRYPVAGVNATGDCGLISFAFDPDFRNNGFVYTGFCTATNASRVVRYTMTETAFTNPQQIIAFSEPQGTTAWHAIGSMGFDPQGNMWLLHGEFTDSSNSQSASSTMGKLLRLVPSRNPTMGGYTPAAGNAYPPGDPMGRNPLIYALGFRSPWRGHLDTRGRFLIGDVGPTSAEELNLVTAAGQNFGWNGQRVGRCSGACDGFVDPMSVYRIPNDPYNGQGNEAWEGREGRAIWVGPQYLDCGNDRYAGTMTGVYLFGDWYAGWVRGAVIDDAGKKTLDVLLHSMASLTSWEQHPDGHLYTIKFGAYGTGGLSMETPGMFRVELAP